MIGIVLSKMHNVNICVDPYGKLIKTSHSESLGALKI